jgi:uncharacterized protein YciI
MFIVLLKFSSNRAQAAQLMAAHDEWIARGFADGAFVAVGTLQPRSGGAILAHGPTRSDLEVRIKQDPFVAHGVVSAELLEISCSKADPRLEFLLG